MILGVFLSPILGTSYKFIRVAERRQRIATADPTTNVGVSVVLETSCDLLLRKVTGSVFLNPVMLSKLIENELIVLEVLIIGGFVLLIISFYLLPRQAYWNSSKRVSNRTLTFVEKRIDNLGQIKKLRKIRKIRKLRCSVSKLGSKICVPLMCRKRSNES